MQAEVQALLNPGRVCVLVPVHLAILTRQLLHQQDGCCRLRKLAPLLHQQIHSLGSPLFTRTCSGPVRKPQFPVRTPNSVVCRNEIHKRIHMVNAVDSTLNAKTLSRCLLNQGISRRIRPICAGGLSGSALDWNSLSGHENCFSQHLDR